MSQDRYITSKKIKESKARFARYLELYNDEALLIMFDDKDGYKIDTTVFEELLNNTSNIFTSIKAIKEKLAKEEAAHILETVVYLNRKQLVAYLNTSPQFASVKTEVLNLHDQIQHNTIVSSLRKKSLTENNVQDIQDVLQAVIARSAGRYKNIQTRNIIVQLGEEAIRKEEQLKQDEAIAQALAEEEQFNQDEALARALDAEEREFIQKHEQQLAEDEALARRLQAEEENANVAVNRPAPAVRDPLPVEPILDNKPAAPSAEENSENGMIEQLLKKPEIAAKLKNISPSASDMFFGEYGMANSLLETLDEVFQNDRLTEAAFYHCFTHGTLENLTVFIDNTPALKETKGSILELFKQFNNTEERFTHADGTQNRAEGALDKVLKPFTSDDASRKLNRDNITGVLKDIFEEKYKLATDKLTPDQARALQVKEDELYAVQLQSEVDNSPVTQPNRLYTSSSSPRLFQHSPSVEFNRDEALLISFLIFEEFAQFNTPRAALYLDLQFQLMAQFSLMSPVEIIMLDDYLPSRRF